MAVIYKTIAAERFMQDCWLEGMHGMVSNYQCKLCMRERAKLRHGSETSKAITNNGLVQTSLLHVMQIMEPMLDELSESKRQARRSCIRQDRHVGGWRGRRRVIGTAGPAVRNRPNKIELRHGIWEATDVEMAVRPRLTAMTMKSAMGMAVAERRRIPPEDGARMQH